MSESDPNGATTLDVENPEPSDGRSDTGEPPADRPEAGSAGIDAGAENAAATVGAATVDAATVDSATVDSATVDSATVDSATVGSGTVDAAELDSAALDASSMEDVTRQTLAVPERSGDRDLDSDPALRPDQVPDRDKDDTTNVKVRIPLQPRAGDTRDEAPVVRRALPLSATPPPVPEEPTNVVGGLGASKWRQETGVDVDDEEFTDVSGVPIEDLGEFTKESSPASSPGSNPMLSGLSTDPIEPLVVPSFSDADPHQLAFAETAALGSEGAAAKNERRSATVQPGEVLLGRYRIGARIGRGGMATVYSAEHVTIGKKVAIKVLDPHLAEKSVYVDRFLQEARAASMISHQNIVDINDFGYTRADNLPFFVMEFLDGEDLRQTLEREGRLPWPRARHIALQICSALEAAHKKGVVHRDIKPENCFVLQRDEQGDFIKLLDFGIAKVITSEPGELTSHGVVLGTLEYMSPERALNKPVDARADIYSLGVLLYRMMTGRTPFKDRSALDIVTAHISEEPAPPRQIAPGADISSSLEEVIIQALSKLPEDRFQSAAELARRLRTLPDMPVSGKPYEHLPMTERQPMVVARASNPADESETPTSRTPQPEMPEGPLAIPFTHPDEPMEGERSGESADEPNSRSSAESVERPTVQRIDSLKGQTVDSPLAENLDDSLAGPLNGSLDDSTNDSIGGSLNDSIDDDLDDDPTQTLSASRAREIAQASRLNIPLGNAVDRALVANAAPPDLVTARYAQRSDTVQSDMEPEIVRVTAMASSESVPSGVVASGVVSTGTSRPQPLKPTASNAPGDGTIDVQPSDIFASELSGVSQANAPIDDLITIPHKRPRRPVEPQSRSVELSSSAERDMLPGPGDVEELSDFAETEVPNITAISERAQRPPPYRRTNKLIIAIVCLLIVVGGLAVWKFVLDKPLPVIGLLAPDADTVSFEHSTGHSMDRLQPRAL